jgi:hypothetical protein
LGSLEDGDGGTNSPSGMVIQHVIEGEDPNKDFFEPMVGDVRATFEVKGETGKRWGIYTVKSCRVV